MKIKNGARFGSEGTRHMTDSSRLLRWSTLGVAVVAAGALLAACGKKHDATQSAARVDGTEITVHQINFRLQRERGLRSDQMDAASRKILDRLIDEQLFVEKAEKEKVDKQPEAQQALDAVRRDVLVHAYLDQTGQSVPAPTEEAVRRYFDDNPALFANRRIYTLHEFLAHVPAGEQAELKAMVEGGKPMSAAVAWLQSHQVQFREQETTRAAEQIPLGALKQLSAMQEGQGAMAASGDQVHLTFVVAAKPDPVAFDRAKPAISQFLLTEARRKNAAVNLEALRTSAKIEYAPAYASLAASGPALATLHDAAASAALPEETGERVSLPITRASGVTVSLPENPSSGVRVSLPNAEQPGVRVSLPSTPASGVEVRLPAQAPSPSKK